MESEKCDGIFSASSSSNRHFFHGTDECPLANTVIGREISMGSLIPMLRSIMSRSIIEKIGNDEKVINSSYSIGFIDLPIREYYELKMDNTIFHSLSL